MSSINKTQNEYKVAKGSQAGYDALVNKDDNTVYFCKDSGNIYLGTNLMFDPNAFNNLSYNFSESKIVTFSCHGPSGNVTATRTIDLSSFALKSEIGALVAGIEAGNGLGTQTGSDGNTTIFNVNVDNKTLTINDQNQLAISPAYLEGQSEVVEGMIEDAISNAISTVYKYKGSCKYSELPTEGNAVGDVYNVTDANGDTPAGTNYAWDGTSWDALGGTISLDGYATEDYVDTAVGNAKIFWNEIVE